MENTNNLEYTVSIVSSSQTMSKRDEVKVMSRANEI